MVYLNEILTLDLNHLSDYISLIITTYQQAVATLLTKKTAEDMDELSEEVWLQNSNLVNGPERMGAEQNHEKMTWKPGLPYYS